ncbi:hypothetical protein GE061_012064 [Apolygus lucorum]|uniref:Small ribosomal subunit protein bS16m n=1 Tax=Apolygus lucorum TaxID=248454 RepID=A0A8S9XTB4_APOLU|nr:hypothetical protein GE061_012064 [Apolygus lucorum]
MGFFPVIFPHAGGALSIKHAKKGIRLARYGCVNRPFYHIVVNHLGRNQHEQPIEQLGTYDPMPNHKKEQLVSLNVERIQYWIGEGAAVSGPCSELFGLAGILPIHPETYMKAWRARKKNLESQQVSPKEGNAEATQPAT